MGRLRAVALVVAALSLGVGAASCSSSSKSDSSSSTGVTTASSSGTPVAATVSDTKGTDAPMTLTPSPTSVKAGDVTFTVKNTGTIDHEMVVLKTDTAYDKLAIGTDEADKVDESASVGETGDPALKPNETRSFTVKDMKPGTYVLVCNIAKHYGLGMRAAFTVS